MIEILFISFVLAAVLSGVHTFLMDTRYKDWLENKANVIRDKEGDIRTNKWFYNPLGGCGYCFTFWGAVVFTSILYIISLITSLEITQILELSIKSIIPFSIPFIAAFIYERF